MAGICISADRRRLFSLAGDCLGPRCGFAGAGGLGLCRYPGASEHDLAVRGGYRFVATGCPALALLAKSLKALTERLEKLRRSTRSRLEATLKGNDKLNQRANRIDEAIGANKERIGRQKLVTREIRDGMNALFVAGRHSDALKKNTSDSLEASGKSPTSADKVQGFLAMNQEAEALWR